MTSPHLVHWGLESASKLSLIIIGISKRHYQPADPLGELRTRHLYIDMFSGAMTYATFYYRNSVNISRQSDAICHI